MLRKGVILNYVALESAEEKSPMRSGNAEAKTQVINCILEPDLGHACMQVTWGGANVLQLWLLDQGPFIHAHSVFFAAKFGNPEPLKLDKEGHISSLKFPTLFSGIVCGLPKANQTWRF